MKRDLSRALLGGVDSALAWGLAENNRMERRRHSRQWAQAIHTWEAEGGRVPDRPTGDQDISPRDDAQARRVKAVLG